MHYLLRLLIKVLGVLLPPGNSREVAIAAKTKTRMRWSNQEVRALSHSDSLLTFPLPVCHLLANDSSLPCLAGSGTGFKPPLFREPPGTVGCLQKIPHCLQCPRCRAGPNRTAPKGDSAKKNNNKSLCLNASCFGCTERHF